MREAGEIIHGENKMRFESERPLTLRQFRAINQKMKEALAILKQSQLHDHQIKLGDSKK